MKRFRTFFGTVLPFVLVATGVFLYLDPEQSGDRLSQWKQDVLSWLFPATDFSDAPSESAPAETNPAPVATAPAAPPAPMVTAPLAPVPPLPESSAPSVAAAPNWSAPPSANTNSRRDLTSVLGLEGGVLKSPPAQLAGIPQAPAAQLVMPPQPERYAPQAIYPAVPQPQARPNAEIRVGSPEYAYDLPAQGGLQGADPDVIWALPEQFGEPAGGWLLNRARQAFWEQDYSAAVEAYRQLITEQAADPGIWGELGNVYYALRDTARAAQAYARAEQAFRAAGNREEAQRLLEVIRGLDATLASQIESGSAGRVQASPERRM